MHKKIRIMITGCGAPGIKGTLFSLRNNPDGTEIYTVGVDMDDRAVGKYFVDAFYVVPGPEDGQYIDALLNICTAENVDVIIPQTTRELSVLSENKSCFERVGTAVMVSPFEAIDIGNNKLKLLEKFRELGLPYPNYRLVTSCEQLIDAAKLLGYPDVPVVVKPPVSNGMRGMRILKESAWDVHRFLSEKPNGTEISLDELLSILNRGGNFPELIVMEYLPGMEYSVDVFKGKKVEVAIPRQRIKVVNGISFTNKIDIRKEIVDYTLRASHVLGLEFAFGFQFKLDVKGIPKLLECNPRVQGTMVASVFSGINVIWYGGKEVMGETVESVPRINEGALFYRVWGGVGVVDGKVVEI